MVNNMKIGIMSMQRVANYGSFLQAFGLKSMLENEGHEVCFVDYHAEKPVVSYRKFDRFFFKMKKIPFFWDLFYEHRGKYKNSFYYLYTKEYLKELNVDLKYKYDVKVDLLVIGSDEVFNCLQSGVNVGFSRELLGDYKYAKRVVSYAASCGYTTVELVEKMNLSDKVRKCMKNFDCISVRDDNTEKFASAFTEKKIYRNVDPVLVSNFEPYIIEKNDLENYIILYSYESRTYSQEEQKTILDFAKKINKEIVTIGKRQPWVKKHINATPFEFLGYVKHADFIITDTFHGTVFSIKYNINFVTIVRKTNLNKLMDLLRHFHLENRCIKDLHELSKYYEQPIDFESINSIIKTDQMNTYNYLKRVTNNDK